MHNYLVVEQEDKKDEYSFRCDVVLGKNKNAVVKLHPNNITIVDLGNIMSNTKEKCQICHKPFRLGDSVIHVHKFIEGKIVNIISGSSVRMENYGEDSVRRIVHSYDISDEVRREFARGQSLWDEGMKICQDIQQKYFKGTYR